MTNAELERRLATARDCETWVAVTAEFFGGGALAFGHGTDNANDEAYWLLRHLQGWRDVDWDSPPPPELAAKGAAIAARRVTERRPLAYLLGEAYFAGLRFIVDERVLVPRSPLAEVLERGFAPWCMPRPHERVLDIGTGSGCIAIAAAHYCPDVRVDATDLSAAALEVAAQNVALHGLASRVRLVAADLFPPGEQRYRIIVSNPPYVPQADLETLPAEYRHEPAMALASGVEGLDAPRRILRGAAERLTEDGVLFMEVGASASAFVAAHPRLKTTWLEFERGGDGVLVTTAEEIKEFLSGA